VIRIVRQWLSYRFDLKSVITMHVYVFKYPALYSFVLAAPVAVGINVRVYRSVYFVS